MTIIGSHGGAPGGKFTVDDSSQEILPDEQYSNPESRPARKYALFVADTANVGTLYLLLDSDGPAVYGKGIPLPPGAAYEITFVNLYQDKVFAIADSGQTGILHVQAGY